jgi:S1-C subfamily serine protease
MTTARIAAMLLLALLISAPIAAQSNRAWLGATVELVDGREAQRLGIPAGLRVRELVADSPAVEGGLRVGDIILSVGEDSVTSIEQMREILTDMRAGDMLNLGVRRANGNTEPVLIVLGSMDERNDPNRADPQLRRMRERLRELDRQRRELQEEIDRRRADIEAGRVQPGPEAPPAQPESRPVPTERLPLSVTIGAGFINLDVSESPRLGITGGIVATRIQDGGAADEAGLREGDVVTRANNEPVKGTGHFRMLLSDMQPGQELVLRVIRDGEELELKLTLRPREQS